MNEGYPLAAPSWASEILRRNWQTLSPNDQSALIADHERSELAALSAELRRTESDRSLGAQPAGMFTLDGHNHRQWHAERFEEPWNGWATPVVTLQTLTNVFDDLATYGDAPGVISDDGIATIYRDAADGEDFTIVPDADGLYHLYECGWTFIACQ